MRKINDNLNEHVNKMNWLEDEGFDSDSNLDMVNEAWRDENGEDAFETVEEMEKEWKEYNILAQVLDNISNGRSILHNL